MMERVVRKVMGVPARRIVHGHGCRMIRLGISIRLHRDGSLRQIVVQIDHFVRPVHLRGDFQQ